MTWAILVAVLLLGAMARFYKLGSIPPGLYHDEAFNGLDAQRVLAGERPLFFTANNGREPLFLYLIALAMAFLGRTPIAIRLPAAVLGTLLVPATFLMVRALFDERVGLWSAFLIAVAPWPVNLSRIGLRAISLPVVLALAVWLWWMGRREGSRWRLLWWALGGALGGLSLYTYTAARFVVAVVAFYVLFQVWVGRERLGWRELVTLSLAAILVAMPLLVYGLVHWDAFVERAAQVSVFNPAINRGNLGGMLAGNVLRAAGLFTFRGDFIPRHNVPFRPLFDPLMSIFFVLGVFLSLRKMRRDGASALTLIWTATMLVPTILAEDCPHFLRAVGVLPVAAVFPAVGLEWVRQALRHRNLGQLGNLIVGGALLASAAWGGYDYFIRHGGNPDLAYAFEASQVQEAVEINRFLGTGWQGTGAAEPEGQLRPGRQVYLAPRMWENRLTTNLLVASPERISILRHDPASEDIQADGDIGAAETDQVLVLAWPHEDMSGVPRVFPHPARVSVWAGPWERGDLEKEPQLLYVAFQAERIPLETAAPVVARFEGGIELLGWKAVPGGAGQTQVELRWRMTRSTEADYTVFVHLVRDGQPVAQDDRFPGSGFLPTSWWRPGDELVDVHVIAAPYDPNRDRIVVGWYEWPLMQHLYVLDQHLQPAGSSLELP